MAEAGLKQLNQNILSLRREVSRLAELVEESQMDLSEEAIAQIEESRKRPVSEFKSQAEMEKKFR